MLELYHYGDRAILLDYVYEPKAEKDFATSKSVRIFYKSFASDVKANTVCVYFLLAVKLACELDTL